MGLKYSLMSCFTRRDRNERHLSLSKLKSNEDNYRRDSFEDRVCDDLSEVILQYLSLEDKFRLECVSKQFQRTVFRSERKLAIDCMEMQDDSNRMKKLEIMLKKLSSLSSVMCRETLDGQPSADPILDDVMQRIIKYCNNLTHFEYNLLRFGNKDIQKKFIEKFGHKLVSVVIESNFLSLNQMPNIEELRVVSNDNQMSDIHLKRLKSLSICNLRLDMDLNEFKAFIERNDKTITHLEIFCQSKEDQSSDNFQLILTIVSNLKNLVRLRISSDFAFNDNSFTKKLIQIAMNCSQLESLSIDYELDPNVGPNWDQYLALRRFKRLKRLDLHFVTKTVHSLKDYLISDQFFAFKGLKALPHLAYLTLSPRHCYTVPPELPETIFTDFETNLPKLQTLIIRGMKINVKESTALMLSRLPELTSIELCLSFIEENNSQLKAIVSEFMKYFKGIRFIINWSEMNVNFVVKVMDNYRSVYPLFAVQL